VTITESDGAGGWKPYVASDLQLEFVMLDPYLRLNMTHEGGGRYGVTFKAPDVYGIYHFRVQYRRPGRTVLYLHDQVSLRPFRHNEYERFILQAYPYYASAFRCGGRRRRRPGRGHACAPCSGGMSRRRKRRVRILPPFGRAFCSPCAFCVQHDGGRLHLRRSLPLR
jgi:hypothetical protein